MSNHPLAVVEDDGTTYGPAMSALSPQQRNFVLALFEQRPGHGALAAAARAANYGNRDGTSTAQSIASIANRLVNNDKIISAIAETTKKTIRADAPAAVMAVREIVSDVSHKDRLRAALSILERIDPVETKHTLTVQHKVDHDKEAIDALREYKRLGATKDFLENAFGFSGLGRYEKLLAIEDGNVVEGEFTEVEPTLSKAGLEDLL